MRWANKPIRAAPRLHFPSPTVWSMCVGSIVSETGIEVDPSKVSAIADWPCPSNASQLRSFLGLINYYREYIQNFAHRAGADSLALRLLPSAIGAITDGLS